MRGAFKKKKVSFHSAHFRKEPFLFFFFSRFWQMFSPSNFPFCNAFSFPFPFLFSFFFFLFFYPPQKKERRD